MIVRLSIFYARRRTGAHNVCWESFPEELGQDKRGPTVEEN